MDLRPLIHKKREGKSLAREEIHDFVSAVISGVASDLQLASLLMAIVLKGMDFRETVDLTREMAHQGKSVPRNPGRIRIGKHSTGGVGDKTTLILGPIVSSFGPEVSLMGGRGLGHTGGTIDKLSGIAGLKTKLKRGDVRRILRGCGFCFFEQSAELAPADRTMYALRDLTGTVESLPLICSSILSKKWAEGLDGLVLDVKFGLGSLMGSLPRARELARLLLKVAKKMGLKATAVLSAMEQPLGRAVGNNLEILESIETLRGHGPPDVTELGYVLVREMLALAYPRRRRLSIQEYHERLAAGDLPDNFFRALRQQGGNLNHPESLVVGLPREIVAKRAGWVQEVNARIIGEACMALGAGRTRIGAEIDPRVGIGLMKKTGERVRKGEAIAEVFSAQPRHGGVRERGIFKSIQNAFSIGGKPPRRAPMVLGIMKNY